MGSCFGQPRTSDAAAMYHASPRRSHDFSLVKRLSLSKDSAPKFFMKAKREVAPAHSTSVKKSASSRSSQSDHERTQGEYGSSVPSTQEELAVGNCSSVAAGVSVSRGNPPSMAEINGRALTPDNITRISAHATGNMLRASSNQDEVVKCLRKHNDVPDALTAVDSSLMKPTFERRSRSEGFADLCKLEVGSTALSAVPQEKSQEIGSSKSGANLKQCNSFEYFVDIDTNRSVDDAACRNVEGSIVSSLSVSSIQDDPLKGSHWFTSRRSFEESLGDLKKITSDGRSNAGLFVRQRARRRSQTRGHFANRRQKEYMYKGNHPELQATTNDGC